MTVFADSSALVTLYAEPDRDALASQSTVVVSQLARVEVPAAIWRKQRAAMLTPEAAQVLSDDFVRDFYGDDTDQARFTIVAVTPRIVDDAAHLTAVHGLRAYDAVQLASAVAARAAAPECSAFAAYDNALRRAAAAEAFTIVP